MRMNRTLLGFDRCMVQCGPVGQQARAPGPKADPFDITPTVLRQVSFESVVRFGSVHVVRFGSVHLVRLASVFDVMIITLNLVPDNVFLSKNFLASFDLAPISAVFCLIHPQAQGVQQEERGERLCFQGTALHRSAMRVASLGSRSPLGASFGDL